MLCECDSTIQMKASCLSRCTELILTFEYLKVSIQVKLLSSSVVLFIMLYRVVQSKI